MLRFHIPTTGHNHRMYFNCRHARRRNTVTAAGIFGRCPSRCRSTVPRLPLCSCGRRLSLQSLSRHLLMLLNSHHGWRRAHVGVLGRLIIPHAYVLNLIYGLLTPGTRSLPPVIKFWVLAGTLTVPRCMPLAHAGICARSGGREARINLHRTRLTTRRRIRAMLHVIETLNAR